MDGIYKTYDHNPPHFFVDDYYYMITGAIYQKRFHLLADEAKKVLLDLIHEFVNKLGYMP